MSIVKGYEQSHEKAILQKKKIFENGLLMIFFLIQFLFCLKVVKAIESGAQALKGINERNDLDKVSDVMDDLNQVYTQ